MKGTMPSLRFLRRVAAPRMTPKGMAARFGLLRFALPPGGRWDSLRSPFGGSTPQTATDEIRSGKTQSYLFVSFLSVLGG